MLEDFWTRQGQKVSPLFYEEEQSQKVDKPEKNICRIPSPRPTLA